MKKVWTRFWLNCFVGTVGALILGIGQNAIAQLGYEILPRINGEGCISESTRDKNGNPTYRVGINFQSSRLSQTTLAEVNDQLNDQRDAFRNGSNPEHWLNKGAHHPRFVNARLEQRPIAEFHGYSVQTSKERFDSFFSQCREVIGECVLQRVSDRKFYLHQVYSFSSDSMSSCVEGQFETLELCQASQFIRALQLVRSLSL